ncbi:MAG: hypothetical protein HQL05_01450 [Nitrospirae bacterium]|uniref:hypothetical protein n=1 Tax=Candidatus Magnetobacterium casense TaxID=1455061 RepID=UPI00058B53FF|nr:hypothetical protein [Candidatus Magnetobacterium casensis]MBF0336475.1 hypothetical protein [Nitrospirota bacterium]
MVKGRQKDKAKGQSQEYISTQEQLTPPAAEKKTSAKKPAKKVSKSKKPTPAKPAQDNVVIPPPVVVAAGVIELQAVLIPEVPMQSLPMQPVVDGSVVDETPVQTADDVTAVKAKTVPGSDVVIEETAPGSMSVFVENIVTFNKLCDVMAAQTCNINAILIDGIRQSMFISYDILKINQEMLMELFMKFGNVSTPKTGNAK